jgi:hypothetical protein
MPGATKTLVVPYFTQPTAITCQSTVLKMFASYLERNIVLQSTGAAERQVTDLPLGGFRGRFSVRFPRSRRYLPLTEERPAG